MIDVLKRRISEACQAAEVAVIMGGPSLEREFSYRSGHRVLAALKTLGWNPHAIDLDNDWKSSLESLSKKTRSSLSHSKEPHSGPLCFMATHGSPGEDGRVQSALDDMGLFYTGAGLEGCVLSMNKWSSKAMMQSCGVHTPKWMMLDRTLSLEDHVQQCAQTLGFPLVLKPTTGGSSIGVRLARDLIECRTALATMATDAQIMAEQCIQGREVTVSILEDDNGRPFVLPIMELEPQNLFYDYETKLSLDKKDFSVPANLTQEAEHQLKQWSLQCHRQLMMRDCSRSDFMIDQDGDLYYLETNAIPGLTENSDLPAQASAAGLAFEEVVLLMLKGAWRRSLALR